MTDIDRVNVNEFDSSDTELERPAKEGDVGGVPQVSSPMINGLMDYE